MSLEKHRPSEKEKLDMPLWNHAGMGAGARQNGKTTECMRRVHGLWRVRDAIEFSARTHDGEDQTSQPSESESEDPSRYYGTSIRNPYLAGAAPRLAGG